MGFELNFYGHRQDSKFSVLALLSSLPLYPLALIPGGITELGQTQHGRNNRWDWDSTSSEFFGLLSTSCLIFFNLFCAGFLVFFLSLWVVQQGELCLLTQVHADVPDHSTTSWTYLCYGKLPFLYKVSFALSSLPFLLYAFLSAYSIPGGVLRTSAVMGFRNKFTQNGKVHLGIAKRFGPIIGIKWDLCNAVITQTLFFF